MPDGYGSHASYMEWVKADADNRKDEVEKALKEAFSGFVEKHEVEVVVFSSMSAMELAQAIIAKPIILKSLLASCNIGGRAIERDLEIKNVDTYLPRLSEKEGMLISGYIKPFLPAYMEIPALSKIDRISFIDKEIRKGKGRWERKIIESLNKFSRTKFKKKMFKSEGETFELDAATPAEGKIEIGVDVKRIEARRDIHKRCDEIVNKASKLKAAVPTAKFGAVIYYPFIDEQVNIQNRLNSPNVDGVVFASESDDSIENAVRLLLATIGDK